MSNISLKTIGILLAVFGSGLFLWHVAGVLAIDEQSQGAGEHHVWSPIDFFVLLIGIVDYFVWRKYFYDIERSLDRTETKK